MLGLPKLSLDPVLFLPLWSGSFRDVSGYGNHATPDTVHWKSQGGVDAIRPSGGAVANLSVAASPSLRLSDQSWFYHAPDGLTETANAQLVISHGGIADCQHRLEGGAIKLFAGGVLTQVAHSYARATSLGYSLVSGEKPEFFINGSSVGLGGTAVTPTASDTTTLFGVSFSRFVFSAGLFVGYPVALEAADFAQLHDYSQSLVTPRKQWPGSGLRYPGRETNLLVDGDMAAADTSAWTAANNADLNKVDDPISGRVLRVAYDGVNQPNARQNVLTGGDQNRAILKGRGDGTYGFQIYLGGVLVLNGTSSTAWQETDELVVPGSAAAAFFSLATGAGYADFGVNKIWTNPPGHTPAQGDPLYLDNLQTARVSVANETSGKLSNTGMDIVTGTWRVSEDATGRYYDCVGAGQIARRLIGADGMTTRLFTESGGATLTKTTTEIQIDAGTGDKIRAVQLEAA